MELNPYEVTVLVSRWDQSPADQEYRLPVDSPDEEHAVSAAMSNAVAFTTKYIDGRIAPVSFSAVAVRRREEPDRQA